MSKYVLRKTGLAFDEKKAVAALRKSGQKLIAIIESKKINALARKLLFGMIDVCTGCSAQRLKVKKSKIIDELEAGMVQQAEIEVEQVIRDDMMIKAYDTLRCECFRVEDNISSVSRSKKCPSDLEQAVSTVIWAADRVDSIEIQQIKTLLGKRYGKEFTKRALYDEDGCVNPKVVERLRYQHNTPPTILKEEYLVNIAKTANVDYRPSSMKGKESPEGPSSPENKPSVSSETLAKRFISSARPSQPKGMKSKRLGGSPPKKDGMDDSQRKSRQQDINPVVIAYLTL